MEEVGSSGNAISELCIIALLLQLLLPPRRIAITDMSHTSATGPPCQSCIPPPIGHGSSTLPPAFNSICFT